METPSLVSQVCPWFHQRLPQHRLQQPPLPLLGLDELLLPLCGSGQITIFLKQGDQVGDGPGVGGGGGEEVSKLEQIASSLALSSA
jgi:hypothetical protein